ncbi:MAG: 2-succinyl-5-enolpyruvyl-6-hydroxy-3-cyclohexene-1-carboxylic-acid synthase [Candidatus Marinimicrobia bacterium]|nr:2-succinyl-5-enolpyruvyl-6-hydroxy-3-cyclohexene-1-carboxylic-acid synthase [Candidatus Neomarinimicrobiota bacterium]
MDTIVKQNTQHIYDLVELCARKGVRNAILSPGSRCAPLIIGFSKHPDIETISVTDERSAGFVGLGIAQQSSEPVVLVCTSGTAAQNFAPAVTEAFYQNVPLIVLTADRPAEWIDQWDGQTIHQQKLFGDHIKGSFNFPADLGRPENQLQVQKMGNLALNLALTPARGPIHVNLPIREPFYPENPDDVHFNSGVSVNAKINNNNSVDDEIWLEIDQEAKQFQNVLIIGGQNRLDPELNEHLVQLNVPIVGDVISNLHGVKEVTRGADFIFNNAGIELKPDLLITIGRSVISKNLKLFLRKNKPKAHWHIGLGMVGDPFRSLSKIIKMNPLDFFKGFLKRNISFQSKEEYKTILQGYDQVAKASIQSQLDDFEAFNEFLAVAIVMKCLPQESVLHLGNSMPVRIANFIGLDKHHVEVWSNRGTAGIDGTLSTAVGHALADQERNHTLITGDLAFFYDRNGLWLNRALPTNLRVIILNNDGGGIFNMIPGPNEQEGLTELFTTPHGRTAELTAREFGLDYQTASSSEELEQALDRFSHGILEIFTDMNINTAFFKKLTAESIRGKAELF